MYYGDAPGGGGDIYSKVTGWQEDEGADDTCVAGIAHRKDVIVMEMYLCAQNAILWS